MISCISRKQTSVSTSTGQDMVHRGAMKFQYVPTKGQVVDVLTKPLSHVNFEHFQYKLGVFQKDLPGKRE